METWARTSILHRVVERKKGGPAKEPRKEGETAEPEKSACRGCRPGALMEQMVPGIGSLGPGDQLKSLPAWRWTEGFMLCLQFS